MDIYPFLVENGSENMAADWWLMEQATQSSRPLFRHYAWRTAVTSFGYGQNWKWVERQTNQSIDQLIRRPTGGGIVRHGEDWTYCMVIPKDHDSFKIPSLELYEHLHLALSNSLNNQSVETFLKPCPECRGGGIPGDCFSEPVGKDLMEQRTGTKIAGAAMKKTRSAILIQGTLEMKGIDWDKEVFLEDLLNCFKKLFSQKVKKKRWPEHFSQERDKIRLQFENDSWLKNRKRI